MTLQDINATNVTDGHTHARMDNMKTVYPPTKSLRVVYKADIFRTKIIVWIKVNKN